MLLLSWVQPRAVWIGFHYTVSNEDVYICVLLCFFFFPFFSHRAICHCRRRHVLQFNYLKPCSDVSTIWSGCSPWSRSCTTVGSVCPTACWVWNIVWGCLWLIGFDLIVSSVTRREGNLQFHFPVCNIYDGHDRWSLRTLLLFDHAFAIISTWHSIITISY